MTPRSLLSRAAKVRVIEIGAAHLTAGEVSTDARGTKRVRDVFTQAWASADGEPGSGLNDALDALRARWRAGGPVHVVIPGHLVLTKVLQVPATAAAQRERIITFEAKQAIPFPLEEVVWGYEILSDAGNELRVLLAAAKTEGVQALLDRVVMRGWIPVAVHPASVALNTMWRAHPPAGQSGAQTAVVLSLGARSTQLLLTAGEHLQLRTLALGGNQLTRAIADRLEQSHAEAERLKLQVMSGAVTLPEDSPASRAVAEAGATFCKRLLAEVQRTLIMGQGAGFGPESTRLWLTGPAADLPGLADALAGSLKIPVAVWAADTEQAELRCRLEWWGATLAAGRGINLLPASLAQAQAANLRRPRWYAAAALGVLALALPGFHYQRLASASLERAASLDRAAGPHRAWQDQIQQHVATAERLETQVAQLDALVAARGAWAGFLADLQERLASVDDVWLERLQLIPPLEREPQTTRLRVSGRLLDRENPLSRVSPSTFEHATALLQHVVESPFVHAIEAERFDAADPGLLRFDFTVVITSSTAL